jgi:hypothetical protein
VKIRKYEASSTPPKVTATISVQPPSTPAGPSPNTTAAIRDMNERSASLQTHSPQEPYVASPHNVFRPPPSAALAVFDRPPSPSFYEALQASGQPAKISPNLQPNQAMPNPFSSPNGSTGPKIKLSLSSLKAATAPSAPTPVDGESPIPPRHPRTSMSVPQRPNSLVSTDTSPYAIGRIQKGKGKAKLNAAIAPETVVGVPYSLSGYSVNATFRNLAISKTTTIAQHASALAVSSVVTDVLDHFTLCVSTLR